VRRRAARPAGDAPASPGQLAAGGALARAGAPPDAGVLSAAGAGCGAPDDARRPLAWVRDVIEALPGTYREAVRLSELDGLSGREVAERLGLSVSGAKSRVQRGRALVKQALDACCRFDFDRRGNLLGWERRAQAPPCGDCGG
jgi:DNA-directed RNA polymerase specialized sigma24 family protein